MVAPRDSKGTVLRLLHGDRDIPWGADPGLFVPEAVDQIMSSMAWMYGPSGYFDLKVRGWDNLPETPGLMVMNHSGGTSIPDVWGFAYAWYAAQGTGRPMRPLAHDMVFSTALTGRPLERMGVLRASRGNALSALVDQRQDVLVLPGGDRETWRPWTERYTVDFGGRQGYIRTALEAGVPLVPIAHAGAHDTFVVLGRGERIARLLHLKELARAEVFPVHLSLPWGIGVGPTPHWPLPGPLRYEVCEPVQLPDGWVPGTRPDDSLVDELDAEVQRRVQAGLDRLRETRSPRRARVGDALERVLQVGRGR